MEILNKYTVPVIGLLVLTVVSALLMLTLHLAIRCSPYSWGYIAAPFAADDAIDAEQEVVVEKLCLYRIPRVRYKDYNEDTVSSVSRIITYRAEEATQRGHSRSNVNRSRTEIQSEASRYLDESPQAVVRPMSHTPSRSEVSAKRVENQHETQRDPAEQLSNEYTEDAEDMRKDAAEPTLSVDIDATTSEAVDEERNVAASSSFEHEERRSDRKRKRVATSEDDALFGNQEYTVAMARPRRRPQSGSTSSSSNSDEDERVHAMWSYNQSHRPKTEAELHTYLNQFSSVHIQHNLKDPIPKDPERYPGVAQARSRRQMAESLSQYGASQFRPQKQTNRPPAKPGPPPKDPKFRGRNPHAYPVHPISETEIEIKAQDMEDNKDALGNETAGPSKPSKVQNQSIQTKRVPRSGNPNTVFNVVTGFNRPLSKSTVNNSEMSLEICCICLEHDHSLSCPGDNRKQVVSPAPTVVNYVQLSPESARGFAPFTSNFLEKKSSPALNKSVAWNSEKHLSETYSPDFWSILPQYKIKEKFNELLPNKQRRQLQKDHYQQPGRGNKRGNQVPQHNAVKAPEDDKDKEAFEWRVIIQHNPSRDKHPT